MLLDLLPDDIFQIFLSFNDNKELLNILSLIPENDYRYEKYLLYIREKVSENNKKLFQKQCDEVLKNIPQDKIGGYDPSNNYFHFSNL